MNVQIQSIHFKADQKLKDYIIKKLAKLEQLYDSIIDAQVFLKVENNHHKSNKTIEVKLNVQNQSIFKTQTSQSFEAATDISVDALKIQLTKYKERLRMTA